ncbi:MAG: hypothetical protein HYZ83_01695 [Candidatus Omnitrophica bacterium]|nr:hypothetical protein [Candidatus Omnitrophota bacterium]
MDGRSDVYALYGAKVFKDYVTIYGLDPNWESLLEKYGMTWAFVPANGGLAVLFNTSPRWKLIYADKVANIFVKDTQENQNLIKKYSDARLI